MDAGGQRWLTVNRREFCASVPLLLAGCGSWADMAEYQLMPSPRRTAQGAAVDPSGGPWTPTLTFATPGDLSVTYGARSGRYKRVDEVVEVAFTIITTVFTHSTGSGDVRITGLPFNCGQSSQQYSGSIVWGGVTKAGYTQVTPQAIWGGAYVYFWTSGSGVATVTLKAADLPTGGDVWLEGSVKYITVAAGGGYSTG